MGIRKLLLAAFAAIVVGVAGATVNSTTADARPGWHHGGGWGHGPGWRGRGRWHGRRWGRGYGPRWRRRGPVVHHYHYGYRPFRPIRRILRGLHYLVHPWRHHHGYRY